MRALFFFQNKEIKAPALARTPRYVYKKSPECEFRVGAFGCLTDTERVPALSTGYKAAIKKKQPGALIDS